MDNGIKWRAMPSDFPPSDRVHAFFRRWRDHLLVREFPDRLGDRVRQKAGRDAEPTAGVIDSQSVKADAVVGTDSRGFDSGKLINGRKRHVVAPVGAAVSQGVVLFCGVGGVADGLESAGALEWECGAAEGAAGVAGAAVGGQDGDVAAVRVVDLQDAAVA